jgi:hypothetical protein
VISDLLGGAVIGLAAWLAFANLLTTWHVHAGSAAAGGQLA